MDIEKFIADMRDNNNVNGLDDAINNALDKQGLEIDNGKITKKADFSTGDFIVKRDGELFADGRRYQQVKFMSDSCGMLLCNGDYIPACNFKEYRHWGVDDTVKGDILVNRLNKNSVVIMFHSFKGERVHCNCYYNINKQEFVKPLVSVNGFTSKFSMYSNNIRPASKEEELMFYRAMMNDKDIKNKIFG